MMKRFLVLCPFLFIRFFIQAQIPEDAMRMFYTRPSGTARQQAIGGAMGSLGGDISATFANPAGLAFYKTKEIVASPGWAFHSASTSYLSNNTQHPSANNFLLGTSGIVLGFSQPDTGAWAVSIAVNRSADFNNQFSYQGNNNFSSASQAYADEFNAYGGSIGQALYDPTLSYGTRMALYTYLADTAQGGTIFQPNKVLAAGGELGQHTDIVNSGGVTEMALGLAGTGKDIWYIGASIGIPFVNFQQTKTYTETDLSGNTNNDFGSYTYTEYYSAKGVGVNFRLGAIYRPNLNWRVGLTVYSPSFYSITDHLSASMVTNSEGYAGTISIKSDTLDQIAASGNSFKYDLQTNWGFVLSGSYVFPGAVTEGKMGFVTADIDYSFNRNSKFSFPLDDNGNQPDNSYFDPVNNTIKDFYRNTLNFRLGGEYKMDDLAFRIGGSYSMDPYSSADLKANRYTFGGGLGYRKKGIFIDLTYVEAILNDVDFPYRLSDKDNVYSTVKTYTGNIILTLGYKF
jgi:hypothetical protein